MFVIVFICEGDRAEKGKAVMRLDGLIRHSSRARAGLEVSAG